MNDNRLKQIRQSEKVSHIKIYTENKSMSFSLGEKL